jgi:succinoglycan biosynthesis transport protein ExoP
METQETQGIMETQEAQGIDIKRFIDILLRRKALILSCILSATILGLVFYLKQPKIYRSTALLNYQQQRVHPAKMSPDEEAKIKDIVSTLSEIVTSRTSLEKLIKQEGLYKNEREQLPIEDVVVSMNKNIKVKPSRRGDTFIVSYQATNR